MLDREEVLKIARLAHLSLSEDEITGYLSELNSILQYIEKLNAIDVKGLEPMSHVHGSVNVFRADEVTSPLPIEETLRNAPDVFGRFIRVPIIIDQPE